MKKTRTLTSIPSLEMRKNRFQEDQAPSRDWDSNASLHPSLSPHLRPPHGQDTSITKKQTSLFTWKEAHRKPPFKSTLFQLLGLSNVREMRNQSQQSLHLQFQRPGALRGAPLMTVLAGAVESLRKEEEARWNQGGKSWRQCSKTSPGKIQVQIEPQGRGRAGGQMEPAKVSTDYDWSKLNFINFLCGKLKYLLFHIQTTEWNGTKSLTDGAGISVLKNIGSKDAPARVSKTKNNVSIDHHSWALSPSLSTSATSLQSHEPGLLGWRPPFSHPMGFRLRTLYTQSSTSL